MQICGSFNDELQLRNGRWPIEIRPKNLRELQKLQNRVAFPSRIFAIHLFEVHGGIVIYWRSVIGIHNNHATLHLYAFKAKPPVVQKAD